MSQNATQVKSPQPELTLVPVRLLGTGAAAPTKELGDSVTVTRLGVGNYRLTWSEMMGKHATVTWGLEGATPLNMAGCTVVSLAYDATNRRIDITLFSGSTTPAVRELAATEKIHLMVTFGKTGLTS